MNIIDSSGWIEIFTGGPQGDRFARIARIERDLVVPALVVAEVVQHVHAHLGDGPAMDALAALARGIQLPFTAAMAGAAARAAAERGLSFRNSLVYAQARHCGAELWTLESALEHLPGVRCLSRALPERSLH
jgi:toxin FitB